MRKDTKEDQANGLRDKVQQNQSQKLPSRSEIHAEKRKKTKFKIKFPIVRLLGIVFLLIPISILAFHFNNDDDSSIFDKFFTPEVSGVDHISIPKQTSAQPQDKNKGGPEEKDQDEQEEFEKEEEQTASGASDQYESEKNDVTHDMSDTGTTAPDSTEEQEEVEEELVIDEEKIEENVEYKEHIVQENETLYRISMKYYNSRSGEKIISDYNNLVNNQIMVGQKLIIPLKTND